jgi:hypothetical protein
MARKILTDVAPEKTVDLQFRAVITKAERSSDNSVGIFRAIVPDKGQVVLDLTSIFPADRIRDVQVDDYAEIVIRIRNKYTVEAESAPVPAVAEAEA